MSLRRAAETVARRSVETVRLILSMHRMNEILLVLHWTKEIFEDILSINYKLIDLKSRDISSKYHQTAAEDDQDSLPLIFSAAQKPQH